MADFSTLGGVSTRAENFGVDLSNSRGIQITSGSANVKGSWVELIASTGIDYNTIELFVRTFTAAQLLMDIGIGSAGNEVVVAENLYVGAAGSTRGQMTNMQLPIYIPSGTRISCRTQASSSSTGVLCSGVGYSGGIGGTRGRAKVIANGADTSDSGGVAVDAGGVADTKGSWVEITSATSVDARELLLITGVGLNSSLSVADFLVDIGIGSAGNEEIIVPNIHLFTDATADVMSHTFIRLPIQVPNGTRIACRMQSSTTASPDDILDMVVYGVV